MLVHWYLRSRLSDCAGGPVLEVAGSLQRSQVCCTQDEVLDTSEEWKAAMIDKGWQ